LAGGFLAFWTRFSVVSPGRLGMFWLGFRSFMIDPLAEEGSWGVGQDFRGFAMDIVRVIVREFHGLVGLFDKPLAEEGFRLSVRTSAIFAMDIVGGDRASTVFSFFLFSTARHRSSCSGLWMDGNWFLDGV
jgi:hypothetical protein